MSKLILKFLTLKQARGRVATAFDTAPDEAAEYIKELCCSRGLAVIGPSASRVTVNEDAKLDFESSVLSRRGRQTRAIDDECPYGEWDRLEISVRIDRMDLDAFIQGGLSEDAAGKSGERAAVPNTDAAETEPPATAAPDAPAKAPPRRRGRPSQGSKMMGAFIVLRDSGKLTKTMSKAEIHCLVIKKLFADGEERPGYSYDTFIKHVGPTIDEWCAT